MGWDGWTQEIRYAVRRLSRRPGFSLVVVLTLALGLGTNTAVFSVLHSVLMAPLPYQEAEQLVRMSFLRSNGRPQFLGQDRPVKASDGGVKTGPLEARWGLGAVRARDPHRRCEGDTGDAQLRSELGKAR